MQNLKRFSFKWLLFLLVWSCFSLQGYSKPLPTEKQQHIIIDTDCAIDDMRAISYILSRPEIIVEGITVADGTLDPEIGIGKVRALLHTFGRDSIPVGLGKSLGGINPPWRSMNSKIFWGVPDIKESNPPDAVQLLARLLLETSKPVSLVCLGPLTNVAGLLEENPDLLDNIHRIVWYNKSVNPFKGFNYHCDPTAANKVFNTRKRIDVISGLRNDSLRFDSTLYNKCQQSSTHLAGVLYRTMSASPVYDSLLKGHFRLADDLVAVYLTNPELFDMEPNRSRIWVRTNIDYDRESIPKVLTDMIEGKYFPNHGNIVFSHFPDDPAYFTYDVRQIMNPALQQYGEEEWKACVMTDEFHGHLGVYSIVGAKMGIKAREIFGVGPDQLEVVSYAGTRPPYSCLNDGIQVSTGATLGQGTISVAGDSITSPSAVFSFQGKSVRLTLKPEYHKQVEKDIQEGIVKFGLMDDGYWKLVRRNALKYWANWSRDSVFEIEEINSPVNH